MRDEHTMHVMRMEYSEDSDEDANHNPYYEHPEIPQEVIDRYEEEQRQEADKDKEDEQMNNFIKALVSGLKQKRPKTNEEETNVKKARNVLDASISATLSASSNAINKEARKEDCENKVRVIQGKWWQRMVQEHNLSNTSRSMNQPHKSFKCNMSHDLPMSSIDETEV